MNKTELVKAMAEKAGLSKKEAEAALSAFLETAVETAKAGEALSLTGYMTMKVAEKAAKDCRNPKTGETVHVPAKKVVKVKLGKAFDL